MKKTVISLESVTYATKAKRLLSQNGIASKVVKLSSTKSGGCQYGIEFDEKDYLDIALLLKNAGMKYNYVKE